MLKLTNFVVKKEIKPQWCEICHKRDLFNSDLGECLRCKAIIERLKLKNIQAEIHLTIDFTDIVENKFSLIAFLYNLLLNLADGIFQRNSQTLILKLSNKQLSTNTQYKGILGYNNWVLCTYCNIKFRLDNKKSWQENRHLRCGTKLKLVYFIKND